MDKNSKPFLRGKKGRYYCWIDGRLLSLRTDKPRIAEARYRELLKEPQKARDGSKWTVKDCLDFYLAYSELDHEPHTLKQRRNHFRRFLAERPVGHLPWKRLTADDVEKWARSHPDWSISTKRAVYSQLLAAFNHCKNRNKISENPLHGLVRPPIVRRKAVLSPRDQQTLIENATDGLREILIVLRETGARPGELCGACVEDYKNGVITLVEHKTDDTGVDRIIYLSPLAGEIVEKLIGVRTTGHIFHNGWGGTFTPDTLYRRVHRLRVKLGIKEGVFPYAFRSRFASDALNRRDSVNPAHVAQLLGHTDLTMLLKHYAREDPDALKRAVDAATKPAKS
jgi:integrase